MGIKKKQVSFFIIYLLAEKKSPLKKFIYYITV